MKKEKHKIIQYIILAVMLFGYDLKTDAQNFELGFRYEPEF
jgi:hypothetical protein